MTSWTPVRPRDFSDRRNAVQNAPSLAVADVKAQHLAAAVGGDSAAMTTAQRSRGG